MNSHQDGLQTRRWLLFAYVLLWPPFLIAATRKSYQVEVLGWWSWRVFVLMIASSALMLLASCILIYCWRRPQAIAWINGCFTRLRSNKFLLIGIALVPMAAWLSIVAYLTKLGMRLDWRLLVGIVDLGLLVLVAEAGLLFLGRERREQRTLLMKCALAGISFLFTIAVIEVADAVLHLAPYASWQVNPRNLDVRFETDDFDVQVITNSQGLRERREIKPRHPGVYRVVVIGDSYTFGWGVENDEAYAKVAEAELKQKYGWKDVEVINMGRPGAAPDDYLKFMRRYATVLKPDLIVVGFLVGDDCPVRSPAKLHSDQAVQLAKESYVANANPNQVERILARSCIARITYAGVVRRLQQSAAPMGEGKRGPIFQEPNPLNSVEMQKAIAAHEDPVSASARYDHLKRAGWVEKGLKWRVNPWLIRAVILRPDGAADSLAVRPQTKPFMTYEWRLCEELMLEMATTAEEMHSDLMIFALPNAHLVSQSWVDRIAEWGCDVYDNMTSSRVVNDWMRDFADRHDIPCVDPLEEVRVREQSDEPLYLLTDDHMNAAGYRLLGEILADAIHKRRSQSRD